MNSEIILCKDIKLDRNYNNVLDYTEEQMVALCRQNQIASSNNYSFIRPTNNIYSGFTYSQCLQANYIAFKNPDYSNKWFFAFIDDVIYKSNKNTEIRYTVDSWSTWFSYWTEKACFVIREHVKDDTPGLYNEEEDFSIGDYIVNKKSRWLRNDNILYNNSDMAIIMGATEPPSNSGDPGHDNLDRGVQTDGIYAGIRYYAFTNDSSGIVALNHWIKDFYPGDKANAIKVLFMIPKYITTGYDRTDHVYVGSNIPVYNYINYGSGTSSKTIDLTNTTLDGYTPVNKKLLNYPYNYLVVNNNNGGSMTCKLEDFYTIDGNGNKTIINPRFRIASAMTPGGSVRLVPVNFKGVEINQIEGLNLGKFPICSWQTDTYHNWLTQQGINIPLQTLTAGIGVAASVATGNPIGIASSAIAIAQSLNERTIKSKIPNQANGNINGADVVQASGDNDFFFYNMSVKRDVAESIDNYFTKYGYKINKLKLPNTTGRQNWNYIEIGQNESIGYGSVPSGFMEAINNACRKGVTIWHNHTNLGDFSLTNSIVT